MSSRSGPSSNRQNPRSSREDFPPLPEPRLPTLRNFVRRQNERAWDRDRQRESSGDRERDRERDRGDGGGGGAAAGTTSSTAARPPTRNWSSTAARRVERIRNLESRISLGDLEAELFAGPAWLSAGGSVDRRRTNNAMTRSSSDFSLLDRSLGEANSHLRILLDDTDLSSATTGNNHNGGGGGDDDTTTLDPHMPPLYSPLARPHDFLDDAGNARRSKRRKVDSEKLGSSSGGGGLEGFRYGRYGQVEPGQLQMEIASCDGGMFSNESHYAAENILRNDFTVYCTKGNRCNIVLRHRGGAMFTLQELVIKAPGPMNYSHPVREGMVFVAMSQDDVLSRTAQYQIQYATKSREASRYGQENMDDHDGSSNSNTHNQRYDDSSGVNNASYRRQRFHRDPRHIVSVRYHDDGTNTPRASRSFIYSDHDESESRPAHMPREFSSNVPDFRVTTECSEEESDNNNNNNNNDGYGGPPRPYYHRTPNRIGSLPFENQDSDSDFDDPSSGTITASQLHHHHQNHQHHSYNNSSNSYHQNRDRTSSLQEAWEAHANATQDAVRSVGGELLTPHAHFFIEEKKSKCTIRFDPPVSGRFILLKMWSSHRDVDGNIDIQSVIARGFAGPRYFPSVEVR